jgi:hypothetical protein
VELHDYKFVKSQPHVGRHYWNGIDGLRVLILGESHYRENGKDLYPRYTQDVVRERKECGNTQRFFGKIADLFGSGDDKFWGRVAFYNYIQSSLLAARQRPDPRMWPESLPAFGEVLIQLDPQFVLVLGQRLWQQLPGPEMRAIFLRDTNVNAGCDERSACLYRTGRGMGRALLFAINHPSSFGWTLEKWRPWIKPAMNQARKRALSK